MLKETLNTNNSQPANNAWLDFLKNSETIYEKEDAPLLPIELRTTKKLTIKNIEEQLTNPDFYEDEPEHPMQKIKYVNKIEGNAKNEPNRIKNILSYVGINGLGLAISLLTNDLAPITITSSITYLAIKKNEKLYNKSVGEMLEDFLDGEI